MDNTESVIAEQKMNVDKAIIDIVGLTASDFTRSVVLPQGKFSEFLQLDDSKRREMLERIFNLEKYGKLLEQNATLFPDRVNAEFAKIIDRKNIEMRVTIRRNITRNI